MVEQWQELKETIIELRDNDGTCTQQEICNFLVNYMNILEKQRQKQKTGYWIRVTDIMGHLAWECDRCGWQQRFSSNYCLHCGCRMTAAEGEDRNADSN